MIPHLSSAAMRPHLSWILLAGLLLLPPPSRGDELPRRLTVATWNVEWFYDDHRGDNYSDLAKQLSAPSPEDWQWKLRATAEVIAAIRPDILALQEIENRRVLAALVDQLRNQHNQSFRVAYVEGGDVFTEQDVAILFRDGLVSYGRREQSREMFESQQYYNVQKHLFAEFVWQHQGRDVRLLVLTAHLRARAEQEAIRKRQARLLHEWVTPHVTAGDNVIVLGDFNSEVAADAATPTNDLGVLRGLHTDNPADDLADLNRLLPDAEQSTHINHRPYDHILISAALNGTSGLRVKRVYRAADAVIRGNGPDGQSHFDDFYGLAEEERDVSDHYPVVAEFEWRE